MSHRFPAPHRGTIVALTVLLCVTAATARAQSDTAAAYRVFVDSVAVGTATSVTNLPAATTQLPQHVYPTLPAKQTEAGKQASVVLTTTDSGLLTVLRAWMGANNSGTKNTVQPKTVEIDQAAPTGGPFRYVLHDAWPSRIDAGASSNSVTIVYQRAEVLH